MQCFFSIVIEKSNMVRFLTVNWQRACIGNFVERWILCRLFWMSYARPHCFHCLFESYFGLKYFSTIWFSLTRSTISLPGKKKLSLSTFRILIKNIRPKSLHLKCAHQTYLFRRKELNNCFLQSGTACVQIYPP